jgi:hypothetical protein
MSMVIWRFAPASKGSTISSASASATMPWDPMTLTDHFYLPVSLCFGVKRQRF